MAARRKHAPKSPSPGLNTPDIEEEIEVDGENPGVQTEPPADITNDNSEKHVDNSNELKQPLEIKEDNKAAVETYSKGNDNEIPEAKVDILQKKTPDSNKIKPESTTPRDDKQTFEKEKNKKNKSSQENSANSESKSKTVIKIPNESNDISASTSFRSPPSSSRSSPVSRVSAHASPTEESSPVLDQTGGRSFIFMHAFIL